MSDSGDLSNSSYILFQGDEEDGEYSYYDIADIEQVQGDETIEGAEIETGEELIVEATNNSTYYDVVEYLDEYQDMQDETEIILEEKNMDDEKFDTNEIIYHTLIEKQAQNEPNSKTTYHCLQCNCEYLSVSEFCDAHRAGNQEKQGEENETSQAIENDEVIEQNWLIVDENEQSSVNVPYQEIVNRIVEHTTENIVEFDLNDNGDGETIFNSNPAEEFIEVVKQPPEIKIVDPEPVAESEDFYCSNCFVLFENQDMLANHECVQNASQIKYLNTEENISSVCEHCGKIFKTAKTLQRHQEKCTVPTQKQSAFTCALCGKCFQSIKALNSHCRMHKNKVPVTKPDITVKCDICNTEFSSEKSLKLHKKMHFKRQSRSIKDALPPGAKIDTESADHFFCEICNKSFDRNLLDVHRNMHRKVEEYVCSICNHHFENLPSYEVHLQMHAEKNNYRTFPIRKLQNNNKGKRVFPCQYCGHEFPRPHEKVKHERVHTGEKPYKCEVCGKCFRVAYSLTLHLRSHTDVRPYACATCNKRFKSHSVYMHHLRTHQIDRPYKCDMCPKSFRTSVQLFGHKNGHNKPFTCLECNRPFASLHDVKKHMKTHIKSNKSNENLKYRCGICGAIYARVFALRLHIKEMHQVDQADEEVHLQHIGIINDSEEQSDDGIGDQMITETIETNEMNLEQNYEEVELSETEAAIQQLTDNCLNNDLNVIEMVEQVVEDEGNDASALIESDGDELNEIVVDNVEIINWDNN